MARKTENVGQTACDAQSLPADEAAAADHIPPDIQGRSVSAAAPDKKRTGHERDETRSTAASPPPATDQLAGDTQTLFVRGGTVASEADLEVDETQKRVVSPLAPTIAEIRSWHRDRVFAMEQRKRSDLALGAFLRRALGWSRQLPKAEAEDINKAAKDLIALGEKIEAGKETGIGNPQWGELGVIVLASIKGRAHWDGIEANATKEMERLAKSLPVWPVFGEPIKGFGARSLAVIVGEAGDLSNYANPAKLWKRMGMAVMDGVRQGGLRKSASADEWIAHGYNAKRRSMMFVIGDVLIRNQNEYRELYLQRKEYERSAAVSNGLTVVPAAKIPAKRKDEFRSDGHIHRRAQRYLEKRLLKNLWQAWRRTSTPFARVSDAGSPSEAT